MRRLLAIIAAAIAALCLATGVHVMLPNSVEVGTSTQRVQPAPTTGSVTVTGASLRLSCGPTPDAASTTSSFAVTFDLTGPDDAITFEL